MIRFLPAGLRAVVALEAGTVSPAYSICGCCGAQSGRHDKPKATDITERNPFPEVGKGKGNYINLTFHKTLSEDNPFDAEFLAEYGAAFLERQSVILRNPEGEGPHMILSWVDKTREEELGLTTEPEEVGA